MANQISKDKQRLNLVIDKKLVALLDAEAVKKGISRTDAIVSILKEHFKDGSNDLDVIKAKLEALEAQQVASTTLLVEAIKKQPIAVQEAPSPAALPVPEAVYERTIFGLYRKKK